MARSSSARRVDARYEGAGVLLECVELRDEIARLLGQARNGILVTADTLLATGDGTLKLLATVARGVILLADERQFLLHLAHGDTPLGEQLGLSHIPGLKPLELPGVILNAIEERITPCCRVLHLGRKRLELGEDVGIRGAGIKGRLRHTQLKPTVAHGEGRLDGRRARRDIEPAKRLLGILATGVGHDHAVQETTAGVPRPANRRRHALLVVDHLLFVAQLELHELLAALVRLALESHGLEPRGLNRGAQLVHSPLRGIKRSLGIS